MLGLVALDEPSAPSRRGTVDGRFVLFDVNTDPPEQPSAVPTRIGPNN